MKKKIRDIKLTHDNIYLLGFHGEGCTITKTPIYRIDLRSPLDQLELIIGDYPESNPNSGIVRVFHPELKDQHMYTYLKKKKGLTKKKIAKHIDYITHEDKENYYGIKYVTDKEKWMNIAHSVTTVGRICDIYKALTNKDLDLTRLKKSLKDE